MSTTVSLGVQRPDGVFDTPSGVKNRRDEITSRVVAVSKDWQWGMVDETTLGILVPADQDPLAVSKQRFVSLLEYCEEDLGLAKVLAVFQKQGSSLEHGFPRTLRYIGFRVVAPEQLPKNVDGEQFFVMSYLI